MGLTLGKILEPYVTDPLRPERPPISGEEGLNALYRAERIDQYRLLVDQSPINRLARANQIYMPTPFSEKRQVPPPDLATPWPSGQVIWMDPSADGGLPHTRPPYFICMARNFPEADLANTLLHERVHVSQRAFPEAWEEVIAQTWDMVPWNGIIPADIQMRRRINPDIVGVPLYIWKNTWVPLALFKSSSQPKLKEIDLVWWNANQRVLSRQAPPGWTEFFGNIPAGEHPFELAAYLVAANPKQNKAYSAIKPRLDKLPRGENW